MARGKTDVCYFGGILDGKVVLQEDTRSLFQKINVYHKSFYAIDHKGGQALLENELKAHLWDHRLTDVYEKMKSKKGVSGVAYKFSYTEIAFRCNAITKAGTRCKNEADLSRVCSIHNKLKSFDIFKHAFNFVEINKEIK